MLLVLLPYSVDDWQGASTRGGDVMQRCQPAKKGKMPVVLLAVKFPYLLVHGGNVHAGKEFAPGFHIIFLRRRYKQVPQLEGLFRAELLQERRKSFRKKRLLLM